MADEIRIGYFLEDRGHEILLKAFVARVAKEKGLTSADWLDDVRAAPGGKSIRVGMISPVRAGVSQVFGRPSSPPPLPKQVVISWVDYAQRQHEREISLEQVLTDPDAQTRDSLVFEITAAGRINVYRE